MEKDIEVLEFIVSWLEHHLKTTHLPLTFTKDGNHILVWDSLGWLLADCRVC